MNVTEIIDQTLGHSDNVDETGADNADRRTRHLEYLRELQAEVWWFSDWAWKKKRSEIFTVPGGEFRVVLPADFNSIGNYGGIYFPIPSLTRGDGRRLELVPESVITDLLETDYRNDTPHMCAIFGQNDFFRPFVNIPLTDSPVELRAYYQPNPSRIDEVRGFSPQTDISMTLASANTGTVISGGTVDFTTQFATAKFVRFLGFTNDDNNGEFEIVGTVTATDMPVYKTSGDDLVNEAVGASVTVQGHLDDIKTIPEKYHQPVLIPGMRSKARESKGDARWQRSLQEYTTGKKWMKMEEQRFQGEWRQLPSFFGRPSY